MKKLFAMILALLMMVSLLAACGGSEAPENDVPETTAAAEPVETEPEETEPEETEPEETEPVATEAVQDNSAAVAAFVETYGADFVGGLESSFATSAGATCTSTIEAVGNGIEVRINIDGLNDVSEENKQAMQAAYDALGDTFTASLTALQSVEPLIESLTIYVCEQDGDLLATIVAK